MLIFLLFLYIAPESAWAGENYDKSHDDDFRMHPNAFGLRKTMAFVLPEQIFEFDDTLFGCTRKCLG